MIDYRGWQILFNVRDDKVVVYIAQEIGLATTPKGALKMGMEEIDKICPEED